MSANEMVIDMDNLRHMLGMGDHIRQRDWGFRNYYNAGPDHHQMPSIKRLVSLGLAEEYRPNYYRATEVGMRAVGFNFKQIQKALAP